LEGTTRRVRCPDARRSRHRRSLFPFGNALALEKEIPGARLLALERVGHEMPPRALWDVVVPTILRHTSAALRADHDPKEVPMQTSD
jgi:hypothetical protein